MTYCARIALGSLALAVIHSAAATPTEIAESVCAACHGKDGTSPVAAFPNLAAQQSGYLAKQLADFAAGKRKNETMASVVETIGSTDFEGLADYFSVQKPSPAKAGATELAAAGAMLYQRGNPVSGVPPCKSCHLAHGEGSEGYPRLARQNPAYTLEQLAAFKSGERSNDKHRYMRTIAKRLSTAEMRALAEFIAGL